jgi:hypothetical protein
MGAAPPLLTEASRRRQTRAAGRLDEAASDRRRRIEAARAPQGADPRIVHRQFMFD